MLPLTNEKGHGAAHPAENEPFVHIPVRDNFYQSSSFFPMPFAMITTINEQGTTSIGPHSLVFPFDISEAAAASTAATTGAMPVDEITQDSENRHASALARLGDQFGLPRENLHMPGGTTADMLPQAARDLGASLVVMGAVSRSRLENVIVGSTAERALDQLPCDVLIIKPPSFVGPVAARSEAPSYIRVSRDLAS